MQFRCLNQRLALSSIFTQPASVSARRLSGRVDRTSQGLDHSVAASTLGSQDRIHDSALTQHLHPYTPRNGIPLSKHGFNPTQKTSFAARQPQLPRPSNPYTLTIQQHLRSFYSSAKAEGSATRSEIDPKSLLDTEAVDAPTNSKPPIRPRIRYVEKAQTTSVPLLLPAKSINDRDAHYRKHGRQFEMRRERYAQIRSRYAWHRRRLQRPGVLWEKLFDLMNVNTASNPGCDSLLVSAQPSALGQLRNFLRSRDVCCEPISRFGKTSRMLVSGPRSSLLHVHGSLIQSGLARVVEYTSSHTSVPVPSRKTTPYHQRTSQRKDPDVQSHSQPLNEDSLCRKETRRRFYNEVVRLTSGRSSLNTTSVIIRLQQMFDEAKFTELVNYRSMQIACSYMLRHKAIREARDLWFQAPDFGLGRPITVFNILLRNCARERNLRAFKSLVEKMVGAGIMLNGRSWIELLQISPHLWQKARIIRHMRQQDLLTTDNARFYIAEPIIRTGLGQFLANGGKIADYLAALRELCGHSWHSAPAVMALLDCLAARDELQISLNILMRLQKDYGYHPDTRVLNMFLRHCRAQRSVVRTVRVLEEFMHAWPSIPINSTTLSHVWKLAWRQRHFGVLRATWRYACKSRQTTHQMRKAMFTSLLKMLLARIDPEQFKTSTTRMEKWLYTCGSVSVGRSPPSDESAFKEDSRQPVIERAKQLVHQWVSEAVDLKHDSARWAMFAWVIQKAWIQDRRWVEAGIRGQILDVAEVAGDPWDRYRAHVYGRPELPGFVRKHLTDR